MVRCSVWIKAKLATNSRLLVRIPLLGQAYFSHQMPIINKLKYPVHRYIMNNMSLLETLSVECPYCGETIELVIDCSLPEQEYIEDCSVCCQPINLTIDSSNTADIHVTARTGNE